MSDFEGEAVRGGNEGAGEEESFKSLLESLGEGVEGGGGAPCSGELVVPLTTTGSLSAVGGGGSFDFSSSTSIGGSRTESCCLYFLSSFDFDSGEVALSSSSSSSSGTSVRGVRWDSRGGSGWRCCCLLFPSVG